MAIANNSGERMQPLSPSPPKPRFGGEGKFSVTMGKELSYGEKKGGKGEPFPIYSTIPLSRDALSF